MVDGNAFITDSIDTTVSGAACSFQNPLKNSGNGWGYEDFISVDDPVLQNNSITFKIDIGYL